MGWEVAGELIAAEDGGQSVVVALISTLGIVLVALIGLATQWMLRTARTSESPPGADPELAGKVAVLVDHDVTDRRTLDQLDRHVDGIGDKVEGFVVRLTDLEQWRREHEGGHP